MKKIGRLLIGLIPIALGVVAIFSSITIMTEGGLFLSWVTQGLFGLSLIIGGVAIISGVRLMDVFRDYF